MIRFFLVTIMISVSFNAPLWAQNSGPEPQLDEAREAQVAQKAKKRLYPGGRDEEDLKVQNQIVNPARKLAPQAEIREEAPEE